MSEARCRADHSDDLSDRDHDGVSVLGQFDVIGGHHIDGPDDCPSIENDNSNRLDCRRDLGEPSPERELAAALLISTRLASLHCPHRRIEDHFDDVIAAVDAGEVRPGIYDAARESVGSGFGAHTLPAVNQLEDPAGEIEPSPPEQLGQLLVLGRLLQPLTSSSLAKVGLDIPIRRLFHLLSRSRHRMQVRR